MLKDQLFGDFQGLSKAEWKQKIEADLKGRTYESLFTTSSSGISIEPVYTSEDIDIKDDSPESGSYRRGSKTNSNDWAIDEVFEASGNTITDNSKIQTLLNSGLTALTISGNIKAGILKGIQPQYIKLGFEGYSSLSETISEINTAFENKSDFPLYLNYDPIGNACLRGVWNKNENLRTGFDAVKICNSNSGSKVFTVNGQNYHNAGGNAISELAFTLAHAHEYLVYLLENGFSIDEASAQIKIDLASGGDYFLEIAKIRAFRIIWAKLIDLYNPVHSYSKTAIIHSHTSQFLSTVYDSKVNMLRATTQAMSAVLGGCDILRVLPYNTAWKNGDDFSKRIARNVQLLLKEESYFDKVIDPAGGSYYIENLTDKLAQKAWEKFRKIEKKGGFIGLMDSGNLNREVKEDAQVQLDLFNSGATKILGVNIFPNMEENMLDELNDITTETSQIENKFAPIELIRLVGKEEEIRLQKELEEANS